MEDLQEQKTGRRCEKTPEFKAIYPALDGWEWAPIRTGELYHTGYTSARAKRCKCGNMPVFEQSVKDCVGTRKKTPADVFVAICPHCELRAVGEGTLEEVLTAWNSGVRTVDSVAMQKKLVDADSNATRALSDAVVGDAAHEAVQLILRRRELMEIVNNPKLSDVELEMRYTELKGVRRGLNELQKFFETSPIMFDNDAEAILSGIRKIVYPEMTYAERVKIPLKLVKM